jgi:hypothetical protein
MNKETHFIRTTDADTKELLLKQGFELIQEDGKSWTFLNSNKLVFADNKVTYTNILNG